MRQSNRGFTLIELMLVTLLLTILASVALPNFNSFRIRSARAEVMTHLSALARAELTYYGANDAFTDDLSEIDWSLQGDPRYLYGFTSDSSASGINDTGELAASGSGGFDPSKMVDSFGILLTEAELPVAQVDGDTFRVGAVGNLDLDPALDRWTLDRDGTATNVTDEMAL